jgi:hypothetical protein
VLDGDEPWKQPPWRARRDTDKEEITIVKEKLGAYAKLVKT